MTNESLGWVNDSYVNFRILAKFIRNNEPTRNCTGCGSLPRPLLPTNVPIVYSPRDVAAANGAGIASNYRSFIAKISSRSIQNIIFNRQGLVSYSTDVPYLDAFRQLESVGQDIIDQTAPSISGPDSAKMSTATLRVRLFNLEQDLAALSVVDPRIYRSFVEMQRIINSIPRNKMIWVINLIAALTFQSWENLTDVQKTTYLDMLGASFICAFNDSELITILLQSETSELILKCSYFYALLKMLFSVFGYSKLTPVITGSDLLVTAQPYLRRTSRGTVRRGILTPNIDSTSASALTSEMFSENCDTTPCSKPYSSCQSNVSCAATQVIFDEAAHLVADYDPLDPAVYETIRMFGDLYPTLVGLMGGTENFPPENIRIDCGSIPADYDCLTTVSQYLWRFNDFSYCIYLDFIQSRQLNDNLSAKVSARAKLLQAL